MPGAADFNDPDADFVTQPVVDLGETAARQGSIVTYHRGGLVSHLDDFEAANLHWSNTASGTGSSVALDTTTVNNGEQSVNLTAGSDASLNAEITRWFPYPSNGRVGVEAAIYVRTPNDYTMIRLRFYDGTNLLEFQIRLDVTNDRVSVLNSSGSQFTALSGMDLNVGNALFHRVKLVVNATTGAYIRAFLDHRFNDMSDTDGQTSVDSTAPGLEVQIFNQGVGAGNDIVIVDDFILTQHEP